MKTTESSVPAMNRRTFVKTSALGAAALSAGRVLGANERINVGLIGFGLIGRFHMAALKEQPDVQVTAVCDVHSGRVEQGAAMAGAVLRSMATSGSCSKTRTSTRSMWQPLTTGTP
jgi:ornithine cyclodeaminase/alanine dehydrogenase-like protein (mu-crystallin family)